MLSEHLEQYALEKYQSRRSFYLPIRAELQKGLSACSKEEAILMRFLYGTMPVRDAGEYDFSVFLGYVRHALMLREHVQWCRNLEEDMFIHNVLYYRINSEDISDCRAFFYRQLKDRIKGMSVEEAVVEINYWCAEHATYQATDGRTVSPMTLYRCGRGRCGEESTFAVTAYRSVGIPARQVYTPRWAHCDDNHAWVEVFFYGKWHFLGACEPEEVLDKGWFAEPASRAILIHSRTFSDFSSKAKEECICRQDLLMYLNNTAHYAKTKNVRIVVKDAWGRTVLGAGVSVEILNMAEYSSAAVLKTDENGEAKITIGLGDVRIRAFHKNMFAEKLLLANQSEAEIVLNCSASEADWAADQWEEYEIYAPEAVDMHAGLLTPEQKEQGIKKLRNAGLRREQRLSGFNHEEQAASYGEEAKLLCVAGENFEQVYRFLSADDNPDRKKMLYSLSEKDYKDLKADILEAHLREYKNVMKELPEEIRVKYLLCPRIYLEELTPYRAYLFSAFSKEQRRQFMEHPQTIFDYMEEHISYAPELDYRTICATPVGCLKMKHGNPLSRKILSVAICRSLGIPARLNCVSLEAEYYDGLKFVPLGQTEKCIADSAEIQLYEEDGSVWNYFNNWTIGRYTGSGFETLDWEGIKFSDHTLILKVESGIYRIITTVRDSNGNQRAAERVFPLASGEQKVIQIKRIKPCSHMTQPNVDLTDAVSDISLRGRQGTVNCLSKMIGKESVVLAFLGVGAEPTEHVLNELLKQQDSWNQAQIRTFFLLRTENELEHTTLQKALKALKHSDIYYIEERAVETLAKLMRVDASQLPLLIAVKGGKRAVYGCSGYHVGSVDLLREIMSHTK